MVKKIIIFDTTLRDGEQSPGVSINSEKKLEIAIQLEKLNVDVIEAGFPAISEEELKSIKIIAQTLKNPTICALSRAKKEDINKAAEALKPAKKSRIHIFLATSPVHMEKKLKKTKEEIKKMAVESVKYAKDLFDEVEFSPEDSARTNIDYLCEIIEAVIQAGAKIINIADTVGYSQPKEHGNIIKEVFKRLNSLIQKENVIISSHCHNDLGLATANSLEAIKQGASQIECTINGIGERAGNCPLEEVVMNIKTRNDFFKEFKTDIKTQEILKTSKMVSSITGMVIQKNKAIVGENAFLHEAGIHQHGILNDRNTYEIINPEEIGWKGTNMIIGKHSGSHAIESLLKKEGIILNKDQLNKITLKIKSISDKEHISKEEILKLAKEILKST